MGFLDKVPRCPNRKMYLEIKEADEGAFSFNMIIVGNMQKFTDHKITSEINKILSKDNYGYFYSMDLDKVQYFGMQCNMVVKSPHIQCEVWFNVVENVVSYVIYCFLILVIELSWVI